MKGWVSGLVVGVVLGSALAGAAQGQWSRTGGWTTGAQIFDFAPAYRQGYAAGASDMLRVVVAAQRAYKTEPAGTERTVRLIETQLNCLENKSGGNLGQFSSWAEGRWAGRNDQAAGVLFGDACK